MGLLKKITGGVKKVVNKVVPKEIAGIMQVAAPFTGAAAPFVYAAGSLRQSGRINPMALASMALPYVGTTGGISGLRYNPAGTAGVDFKTARDLLGLRGAAQGTLRGRAEDALFGSPEIFKQGSEADGMISVKDASQGILGTEGDFNLTKGKLLSKKDGTLSYTKVAAAASAGLSLAQTQAQITEEAEEVGLGDSQLAALQQEAAEMWEDFDTTQFKPKITAAIGGLMRKNLREGSEGNELPPDPTKPIGVPPGFKPVPIGPVLPNKAEASPMELLNSMAIELFGKPLDQLDDRQRDMIMSFMKPQAKQGGLMRSNFALGTKPTSEESGLGGLPIEADMRYSGGFMPYGEKEKADDVPARLSKNEFVFTADAVRAAGGGSIQKGAQKMYNSMKQLESMGRSFA